MAIDPFLPYARQSITVDDISAVGRVLSGDLITRGPEVEQFEKALAQFCGAAHAVVFNSGTTALQAACHAAQLGPQDHVFTTPNSFVATATAVIREGASPVFIDIDPDTGNMDLELLAPNLHTNHSRGRPIVIPVHYGGLPVEMQDLDRLITHPDTVIIEDAAAALGSYYDDEYRVGSCRFSQMTMFSFHPAKLITTGEGGAVTTNDADLCHRLKRFRNNGIEREEPFLIRHEGPWYYEVHEVTGNYHVTDFQAALGLSQLGRIEQLISKRQQILDWYHQRLSHVPYLQLLLPRNRHRTAPQLLVVRIDFEACRTTRAGVMNELRKEGVGTQVHYLPIYRHPYFEKQCGDLIPYFPGMELFYSQALSLPLYQDLEETEVDRVCRLLAALLR